MTAYRWDYSFLADYYWVFLAGLGRAAQLTMISLVAGTCLGLLFGAGRSSRIRVLRLGASCYVEFFRNIPPIVQLFWWYYTIPIMFKLQGGPFLTASIALSLYTGAFFAEIFRSGIESIERGQVEASKALGLGYLDRMRYVVIPQATRRIFPALAVQAVETVKLTSIASSIAFPELLYSAKLISSTEYRPLEAFTVAALIYIGVSICLSSILHFAERRMGGE